MFATRFVAMMLFGSVALVGLAVPAAQAAQAAPAVSAGKIAGVYTLFFNFDNHGYATATLTLKRDHTGNDAVFGQTVTWSSSRRTLTMVISSSTGSTTYLGTVSKTGFDRASHPGTMSSTSGTSGVWYAVRKP